METDDRLLAYPWSSFPLYSSAPKHRLEWLRADRLLGEHGIHGDIPAGRHELEQQMERRRLEEVDEEKLEQFRRAWCLGSEPFRKECLEQMEGKVGDNHPGATKLETAEAKAERLIMEELVRLDWTEEELRTFPKSDPRKLAMAGKTNRRAIAFGKAKRCEEQSTQTPHSGRPVGHRAATWTLKRL